MANNEDIRVLSEWIESARDARNALYATSADGMADAIVGKSKRAHKRIKLRLNRRPLGKPQLEGIAHG